MPRYVSERRVSPLRNSWMLCGLLSSCVFHFGLGWTTIQMTPSKSAFSNSHNTIILSKQRSLTSLRLLESDTLSDSDDAPTLTVPSSVQSSITLDGLEIRQPITAVNNIVIVKVKDALSATGGGILLPDQSKQRPTEGLVVKAGPGKLHPFTGVRITNPIQEGMSVVYGQYDGRAIEYNGEECQVIRDDNVLLVYSGVTLRLDNVTPVRDYVLIELDSKSNAKGDDNTVATSSGIVLAASVLKDSLPCEGRVVLVGEGRMSSTGTLTNSPVKVGDVVKFKEYAGNDIIIEGKQYSVVKMVDILCTFTE